jgi:hypothetical protein
MRRNPHQTLVPMLRVGTPIVRRSASRKQKKADCRFPRRAWEPGVAFVLGIVAAAAVLLGAPCFADDAPPPRERAIYVPFSELHVILQQQPKRVLLGRAEFY